MCDILTQLRSGQLLMVNSRKRNGLILYKPFHAEFAGPGAAIGGEFDRNCERVVCVGELSVIEPSSSDDRQKAYLIRRQWIRLIQQITDTPDAHQRVRMLLQQFENYFSSETIKQVPDEAFAQLVGVLPHTVYRVRHSAPSASENVNS
ncbi:hypothetical protein ACN4EG_22635 [Alkalinema pantanalense CENA528]|uniref:hypothetical protein n=1 Tax=Alkalinema pantanalense TaxID=1620705 RepID=UPI003D6DF2D1